MKKIVIVALAAALAGPLHAQPGSQLSGAQLQPPRPQTAVRPGVLSVQERQLRFRALMPTFTLPLPPISVNLVYSINRRPAGTHVAAQNASAFDTYQDFLNLQPNGNFIMSLPAGAQGKHLFDCSVGNASELVFGTGAATFVQQGTASVQGGHALFIVDAGAPRVLIHPKNAAGQATSFFQCDVTPIPG